jgi:LysM repeat protein
MPEFEQLKQKYQSVLETIQKQGGQLQNLNRDGDQLFVKATVPSEEAKNRVWDAIKAADPNYTDLKHEIEVSATASQTNQTTYTVQPGDNLSKISQHFYGDANKYNTIVKANNLANPIRSSRDKNSSYRQLSGFGAAGAFRRLPFFSIACVLRSIMKRRSTWHSKHPGLASESRSASPNAPESTY